MNSHETYLIRLIEEANSALNANTDDDIKRFYNLSRFFTMIDAIKKELNLLETMEYHIPLDVYDEALRLLSVVE